MYRPLETLRADLPVCRITVYLAFLNGPPLKREGKVFGREGEKGIGGEEWT
jgi:hypothetical protein